MTLRSCRQKYYDVSTKAGDVARQLSFAGIALLWVLKDINPSTQTNSVTSFFSPPLLIPALIFALALTFDLLQYFVGSIIWSVFCRIKERTVGEDDDLTLPIFLNWPSIIFFYLKLLAVTAAYICIFCYINIALT